MEVDAETRCVHYRTPLDVIAIKMPCCGVYYACKDCHATLAGHEARVWPRSEWNTRAILCGACGHELTIHEYMSSSYACPHCKARFNPGCKKHSLFYFASDRTI